MFWEPITNLEPRPAVWYLTACTSHHKLMQSDWETHWTNGEFAEANADEILIQFCILAWFEALFLKSYSRLKTDTMADTDDNHYLGSYYVSLWLNVRVTYRLTISPRNIFLVHERTKLNISKQNSLHHASNGNMKTDIFLQLSVYT
jgi:hypothetical protein